MTVETGAAAGEPAVACAQTIVGFLIGAGVTDAVLAPGSRSAPFAYVLAAADAAGLLRLHVRVDERTAGFLALGLAKAGGRPVPVITTSGTAAANLHPAVLEADAAGVPLIAITADRPGKLRHSGANQTTDQLRLFGPQVRGFAALDDGWRPAAWRAEASRLVALASGTRSRHPGPVQLNVSLSDPLFPAGPAAPIVVSPSPVAAARRAEPLVLPAGPRTVVVAGDAPPALGRSIAAAAARAGVPLIAEPSSNARRGPAALAAGRLALGVGALSAGIERVVVVGRPTLNRAVNTLLTRDDIELIVVSEDAGWPDPGRVGPVVVDAVELAPDDTDWLDRWQHADRRLAEGIDQLLGVGGGAVIGELPPAASAGSPALAAATGPGPNVGAAVAAPPLPTSPEPTGAVAGEPPPVAAAGVNVPKGPAGAGPLTGAAVGEPPITAPAAPTDAGVGEPPLAAPAGPIDTGPLNWPGQSTGTGPHTGRTHTDGPLTGPALARTLVECVPPGTPLVIGSSNPIRDLDLAPIRDDLGDVYANRGLAGIDGTISSAVGVALAVQPGMPGAPAGPAAHALVGDLTFLHDLTGLVIGPGEPRPDLRIVVADDGGGSIFSTLEHGRPELAGVHERVFATPHGTDPAALAAALGIPVVRVRTVAELAAALAVPPDGIEVVHAIVDRAGRRALDRAITALAASL